MRWFFRRGFRVLMYHKVSATRSDPLTVSTAQLRKQLSWLKNEGFRFVTLSGVAASLRDQYPLTAESLLVTFDDAYRDTYELALPVLHELRVPAAIFVPTAFIGKSSAWDIDARPIMDTLQLRELAKYGVEIGLHSHRHENYREATADQIERDVRDSCETLLGHSLPFVPSLAYPFGGRPEGAARAQMQDTLRRAGIALGFRIGNRINRVPLIDPYEINRLDVRGDKSFTEFCRKLAWGRWW